METGARKPATVQIQFLGGARNATVAYTIPFQLQSRDSFSMDFGTRQVDNLSAQEGLVADGRFRTLRVNDSSASALHVE